MPETASRNAFLRLTDCGKARFVLPESLFRVVTKPLPHCRKGFSVMRESPFRNAEKALSHNRKVALEGEYGTICWLSGTYANRAKPAYLQPESLAETNTRVLRSCDVYLCVAQGGFPYIYTSCSWRRSSFSFISWHGWRCGVTDGLRNCRNNRTIL